MKKEEKATTEAKDVQWENVKPVQPEDQQPAPKSNNMLLIGGGMLLLVLILGFFFYSGSNNTNAETAQATEQGAFLKKAQERGIEFAKTHPYMAAVGFFAASILTGKAAKYLLSKSKYTRPIVDRWNQLFSRSASINKA